MTDHCLFMFLKLIFFSDGKLNWTIHLTPDTYWLTDEESLTPAQDTYLCDQMRASFLEPDQSAGRQFGFEKENMIEKIKDKEKKKG